MVRDIPLYIPGTTVPSVICPYFCSEIQIYQQYIGGSPLRFHYFALSRKSLNPHLSVVNLKKKRSMKRTSDLLTRKFYSRKFLVFFISLVKQMAERRIVKRVRKFQTLNRSLRHSPDVLFSKTHVFSISHIRCHFTSYFLAHSLSFSLVSC